jgi:pantoate--beta-alanine ligase
VRRITELSAWRCFADEQRGLGRRVGLVATMGALHAGHASLFQAAKDHGDVVLATLFVNPRQFHDGADLAAYPRNLRRDLEAARVNGVDCLVTPTLEEMWPSYPAPTSTTVSVHGLAETLEGADRPGHFDGVASVVAKILAVTGPCRAYFGEKDFQQLAVVRQMVRDLAFDAEVVGCAIVRDADGLALSSRNALLGAAARQRARALSQSLRAVQSRRASPSEHRATMARILGEAGLDVAYAEVVDPVTFAPCADGDEGVARAMVAARVDGVRLIDNAPVTLMGREG